MKRPTFFELWGHSSDSLTVDTIPGAIIELGESVRPGDDGRTRWAYSIRLIPVRDPIPDTLQLTPTPIFEYVADDIQSGIGGGTVEEGLRSLMSFLSAFAEAIGYEDRTGRKSENSDLFPKELREWAHQHNNDISAAAYDLSNGDENI
jgi:hypothetical protein